MQSADLHESGVNQGRRFHKLVQIDVDVGFSRLLKIPTLIVVLAIAVDIGWWFGLMAIAG